MCFGGGGSKSAPAPSNPPGTMQVSENYGTATQRERESRAVQPYGQENSAAPAVQGASGTDAITTLGSTRRV